MHMSVNLGLQWNNSTKQTKPVQKKCKILKQIFLKIKLYTKQEKQTHVYIGFRSRSTMHCNQLQAYTCTLFRNVENYVNSSI